MARNDEKSIRCSFCGKHQDQVKRMIAGPGVYICDECVNLCMEAMGAEGLLLDDDMGPVSDMPDVLPTPKEIQFYINSPGGSVTAGMAIYDTMQYVKCDVSTICIGLAASMGAFLLAAGTKGKRLALPNAEIMIHQPSAGTQGQITDMALHLKRLEVVKSRMNRILAENTGKSVEQVTADCERDNFMTAQEALEYGLIDKVIEKR